MTYSGIAISNLATVSYLEETVKGTMDTTPSWVEIGRVSNGTIDLGQEHISAWGLGVATRNAAPAGNKSYELSFDFFINDVSIAFLTLFDGTDKTYTIRVEAGLEAGAAANTHYMYCLGGRLNEASVSGSQGGNWESSVTIPFVQVDSDMIVDTIETGETEFTISTDLVQITNVGDIATGTGWTTDASTTIAEATDAEVSWSYGYEPNYVLSSVEPEGIYSGNAEASFSFTADWIDADTDINVQFKRMLSGEAGIMILTTDAASGGMILTLAGCAYDELSASISQGSASSIDISGTANSVIVTTVT